MKQLLRHSWIPCILAAAIAYALPNQATGGDAGAGATTTVPIDQNIQVNSYTTGAQMRPEVAGRPGGGFVVVWEAHQPNAYMYGVNPVPNSGIFGQRLTPRGEPFGTEFQIDTTSETYDFRLFDPAVEQGANGEFVVTWFRRTYDGIGTYNRGELFAQRVGPDASLIGPEILLHPNGGQPDISLLPDGRFVASWQTGTGDHRGIIARSFAADGTPISPELMLSDPNTSDFDASAVATTSTGNFIVIWNREVLSGFGSKKVFGARYSIDGTLLTSQFVVHSTPATSGLRKGSADVDATPSGNFVVVWASQGLDGDKLGIFARRFNANALPLGDDFQVNTYTTGDQAQPSVQLSDDGSFFVTWQSDGQDGDGLGIFGRTFGPDGQPTSGEFAINDLTANAQSHPAVGGNGKGDYLVVWEDFFSDGALLGIFGQPFRPAELFTDGFESGDTSNWSVVVP